MRREGCALVILFSTLILASAHTVLAASPNVWCEPARIPPGQDVTIHIRASWLQTNITKIEVINPDGITWTWTGEIRLPDEDDEISVTFPGGLAQKENDPDGDVVLPVITWPAGANTNADGEYTVYTYGEELSPGGTKFDVSSYFGVPEFELAMPIILSIGFLCFTILRRKH